MTSAVMDSDNTSTDVVIPIDDSPSEATAVTVAANSMDKDALRRALAFVPPTANIGGRMGGGSDKVARRVALTSAAPSSPSSTTTVPTSNISNSISTKTAGANPRPLSVRITVELCDHENGVISYPELLRKEKTKDKGTLHGGGGGGGGHDNVLSTAVDDNEMKFEGAEENNPFISIMRRYATGCGGDGGYSKRKKRKKTKRVMGDDEWYDTDDPFIDDADAANEAALGGVLTKHGGYYVNFGHVEVLSEGERHSISGSASESNASDSEQSRRDSDIIDTDDDSEGSDDFESETLLDMRKRLVESKKGSLSSKAGKAISENNSTAPTESCKKKKILNSLLNEKRKRERDKLTNDSASDYDSTAITVVLDDSEDNNTKNNNHTVVRKRKVGVDCNDDIEPKKMRKEQDFSDGDKCISWEAKCERDNSSHVNGVLVPPVTAAEMVPNTQPSVVEKKKKIIDKPFSDDVEARLTVLRGLCQSACSEPYGGPPTMRWTSEIEDTLGDILLAVKMECGKGQMARLGRSLEFIPYSHSTVIARLRRIEAETGRDRESAIVERMLPSFRSSVQAVLTTDLNDPDIFVKECEPTQSKNIYIDHANDCNDGSMFPVVLKPAFPWTSELITTFGQLYAAKQSQLGWQQTLLRIERKVDDDYVVRMIHEWLKVSVLPAFTDLAPHWMTLNELSRVGKQSAALLANQQIAVRRANIDTLSPMPSGSSQSEAPSVGAGDQAVVSSLHMSSSDIRINAAVDSVGMSSVGKVTVSSDLTTSPCDIPVTVADDTVTTVSTAIGEETASIVIPAKTMADDVTRMAPSNSPARLASSVLPQCHSEDIVPVLSYPDIMVLNDEGSYIKL